eukprot:m.919783 g.919783  ORF g.919783 m.919783 type:complete len:222 (+) comp60199_c0_seq1:336-1001(+)
MSRRFMSLDTESVASGRGHDERALCQLALVDASGAVLLNEYVTPDVPIVSFLTPLTGISADKYRARPGLPRAAALDRLRGFLGPDVVLVGQSIQNDIAACGLRQGIDFHSFEDLAEHFKTFNAKFGRFNFFSLRHEAEVLLGKPASGTHDAADDAIVSIELYNRFCRPGSESALKTARSRLLATRPAPSVAKLLNYRYEGVCMAAYFPEKCFCGRPTKAGQ